MVTSFPNPVAAALNAAAAAAKATAEWLWGWFTWLATCAAAIILAAAVLGLIF